MSELTIIRLRAVGCGRSDWSNAGEESGEIEG